MYLLAFLLPPLAILLTGRIFQAIFSIFLLPFYFPSALWAILVVADHKANQRTNRLIDQGAKIIVNEKHNARALAKLVKLSIKHEKQLADDEQSKSVALKFLGGILGLLIASPRIIWLVLVAAWHGSQRFTRIAVRSYHELPEWAQPITWGLAAGTPFAIIAAILFMTSR